MGRWIGFPDLGEARCLVPQGGTLKVGVEVEDAIDRITHSRHSEEIGSPQSQDFEAVLMTRMGLTSKPRYQSLLTSVSQVTKKQLLLQIVGIRLDDFGS